MSNVVNSLMRQAERMDRPVDAFDFCRLATNLLNTEIDVIASQKIPFGLPAFVLRLSPKAALGRPVRGLVRSAKTRICRGCPSRARLSFATGGHLCGEI